jgi:hypothetical protein
MAKTITVNHHRYKRVAGYRNLRDARLHQKKLRSDGHGAVVKENPKRGLYEVYYR